LLISHVCVAKLGNEMAAEIILHDAKVAIKVAKVVIVVMREHRADSKVAIAILTDNPEIEVQILGLVDSREGLPMEAKVLTLLIAVDKLVEDLFLGQVRLLVEDHKADHVLGQDLNQALVLLLLLWKKTKKFQRKKHLKQNALFTIEETRKKILAISFLDKRKSKP
jgi:hypothetical protein